MNKISGNTWQTLGRRFVIVAMSAAMTACGGGSGDSSSPTPPVAPPAAVAPSITTQPASVTVNAGSPATFSVTAAGTAPLTYQWQRDGKDIAGATAASYTLTSPDVSDNGAALRVSVSNAAGSVTSAAATLTVNAVVVAPAIVTQPQSVTVQDGGSATFSVGVSGTGPFTYRWQLGGKDIADATAASYTTAALALADSGGVYSVVVGNGGGSVTSASATLTVKPRPPVVTAAPASVSVSAGQTASFSVTADGSAPLTYQWQRNGADIAGATGASYTTPVLTVADNGASYRVVIGNAASSVTSASASVSVSSVAVAPSVTTAPQSLTVTAGQTASFSVVASGTGPLSYQWQRNGADIAGATAASYTTAATTLADNGAKFGVRIGNAAGSLTSTQATLTVNALTSVLSGRAWTQGLALETDDNAVADAAYGIDDQGRVMAVFLKSNGSRAVLYATRGTPGAAGTAPSWSTPVAIDLQSGTPVNGMTMTSSNFDVAVAPNGNAVARWYTTAACTANTYKTSGTCNYLVIARYLAASGAWEAPVTVTDSPSTKADLSINSAGDVAMAVTGWKRSGTSSYTSAAAVWWKPNAAATFQGRVFSEVSIGNFQLGLDAAGNMLVAAEANQNATTDLVAYRGTQSGGFGPQLALENRGAAAQLQAAVVGAGGQQLVIWSQNNGTVTTLFAAAATSPGTAFDMTDIGVNGAYSSLSTLNYRGWVGIADDGTARVYHFGAMQRLTWSNGAWAPTWQAMPGSNFNSAYAFVGNRNGDLLVAYTGYAGGYWGSYDGTSNLWIQPPKSTGPYVLGAATGNGAGYFVPVLSNSGTGALLMLNKFDVLPTATAPAGDGRNVTNLWGLFLK